MERSILLRWSSVAPLALAGLLVARPIQSPPAIDPRSTRGSSGATSARSAPAASPPSPAPSDSPAFSTSAFPPAASGRRPAPARRWYPVFDVDQGRLVGRCDRGRAIGSERHLRRHGRHDHGRRRSTKATASTSPPTPARRWQHLGPRRHEADPVDPRRPARSEHRADRRAGRTCTRRATTRGVFAAPTAARRGRKTLFVDDSTGMQKLALGVRHAERRLRDDRCALHAAAAAAGVSRRRGGRAPTRGPHAARRSIKSTRRAASRGQEITGGGLPARSRGRTSVAVAMNTNAQRVFLIGDSGLYRSDDGGDDVASDGRRRSAHSQRPGRLQLRRLRRSAESRRRLHDQHVELQVDATAATPSPASRARRAATIRSRCGSIPTNGQRMLLGSIRARSSRSTAAPRGARGTTSRPSRSTTSRSTTRFRTGSTARSRTPAPSARASAATSARSRRSTGIRCRAGSGARSSPTRSTRTPSTRAARAS